MNKLKALILIPLLLLASCNQDKLLQVSYDVQVGINTAAKITVAAHQSGILSDAGFQQIATVELDVNNAYIELEKVLKVSGGVTKENKASVLALIQSLSTAAGNLGQAGTLHIKNPDKLKAFMTAVAAIQAATAAGQIIVSAK